MKNELLDLINLASKVEKGDYDWETLMKLAQEQSVIGVALQGMQTLSPDMRPPRNILLKWITLSETIKRQNEKVNHVLQTLVSELEGIGVKPFIVKGQVIAQEYKEPLLRQSGDIDVLIAKDDWNAVRKWLEAKEIGHTSLAPDKHIEIDFHGVTVELHHHLNAFSSKRAMTYWANEIEGKITERQRVVNIDGTDVLTLGATDTLVHLLVHVHHHLLTEGVGLRQLMDMALFVNNHFDELELSLLRKHLVGIDHVRALGAYMALLGKYLRLPKDKIPFELDLKDYAYADKIMDEVWKGGNFGYKNHRKGLKMGFLHSVDTARILISHSVRFYRLAPSESRNYWLHRLLWRGKKVMNAQ